MMINSIQSYGASSISDYYQDRTKDILAEIRNFPPQRIIGTDTNEITQYFLQKHALSPLEIDEARQIEYEKVIKKVQTLAAGIFEEKILAKLIFPLNQGLNINQSLLYFAGRRNTIEAYQFDFDDHTWTVGVIVEPKSIESSIQTYKTLFQQRTREINAQNLQIERVIKDAIEQRKKKITGDNQAFEAMIQKVSIPLKQRNEAPYYQPPIHIREDIKKLTLPTATMPKKPILSPELLDNIIKAIDVDGKSFENAPETFKKLDEPELRDIIISHLNHYFPGDVTGESFSKLGKADIRLKVVEGETLIAECKFWTGGSSYHETINQLFRYLTWRYNYGLIIIFSTNTGFTDVLNKVKEYTQMHTTYEGGVTELSQTHFKSIHKFPEDPQKKVEIHVLVYNLYYKKG